MDDAVHNQRWPEQRYAELVWLIRHQLALQEQGTYADGVAPDSVQFAQTWVRAKVRRAIDWGALPDEYTEPHRADSTIRRHGRPVGARGTHRWTPPR